MYELVQHQRLTSSAANITFSNIPQNGLDLILVYSLRTDLGTAFHFDDTSVRINNDTSTIYSGRLLQAREGSISSGAPSGQNNTLSPESSASGAPANTFGNGQLYFPNYTASGSKTISAEGASESNSNTLVVQMFSAGFWNGNAPITSLTLYSRNNTNFVAGSSATLYKVVRTSAFGRPKATGGNITYANGYWVHTFTGSGVFSPQENMLVDTLVVGGGGSGAYGGGGAGGFREAYSLQVLKSAPQAVLIGAGGPSVPWATKGTNGGDSVFATVVSAGGGAGGTISDTADRRNGNAGGSGGGGGCTDTFNGEGAGGAGNSPSTSPSQGNSGGTGHHYPGQYIRSGGGGGAGGAGSSNPYPSQGTTAGGAGAVNYFSGTGVTYAVGGNGGTEAAPTTSPANSGKGGNGGSFFGGSWQPSDAGGSGIVIVRYRA